MHLQEQFEAIGTHWTIDIFDAALAVDGAELFAAVRDRIAAFDAVYSRFRSDSVVSEMARTSGEYQLPEDATLLIELYQQLYVQTDGAFTPMIGKTLEQAGYDAEYSLKPKRLTTPLPWDEVCEYNPNTRTLTLHQPALLDFGAAGKGYLVDIVGELLETYGIQNYIVDAGSDIRHRGAKALDVGLENPTNTTEAIGVATVSNKSLCASAGNRRKWEGFHHIINPHTLQSPDDVLATWAIADTTLVADGVATALFLALPEKLVSHFHFDYLILYSDFSIKQSPDFPARIFLA